MLLRAIDSQRRNKPGIWHKKRLLSPPKIPLPTPIECSKSKPDDKPTSTLTLEKWLRSDSFESSERSAYLQGYFDRLLALIWKQGFDPEREAAVSVEELEWPFARILKRGYEEIQEKQIIGVGSFNDDLAKIEPLICD